MGPFASASASACNAQNPVPASRQAWCAFLLEREVHVGVSINGPEDMNTHRVTLAGHPGFRVTMRGIERLRRHGIPFSAIAVVSDPAPENAARFYDFFAELGVTTLGVNLEGEEGVNRGAKDSDPVRATEFWAALADAWRANPVIRLREIQRVLNFAGAVLGSHDTAPTPMSWSTPAGGAILDVGVGAHRAVEEPAVGRPDKAARAAIARRRPDAIDLRLAGVDWLSTARKLAADPAVNADGAAYPQGYGIERYRKGQAPPD
ncbi:hypothetical protein ACFCYC_30410 [Streptomyces sp. NPDC056402]|uniref:hypothetical protein n=1 Tax=Streptomyces sp. NPDC056402 TaxID=3345810 RepID=UPI0035E1617A